MFVISGEDERQWRSDELARELVLKRLFSKTQDKIHMIKRLFGRRKPTTLKQKEKAYRLIIRSLHRRMYIKYPMKLI